MENKNIQTLFKDYLQTGCKDSLNQFLHSVSQMMYQVAYKYTQNSADAEDALQNAILYIIEKREKIKKLCNAEDASIKAWCLKVVINMAKMQQRQKKSRSKREFLFHSRRGNATNHEQLNEKNQVDSNSKILTETLEELPEKYRMPIYLKYFEDFSLKDIAVTLSTNPNTLRSNVKRGLGQLSERLRAKGVLLSATAIVTLFSNISAKATEMPQLNTIVQKAFNDGISGKKPMGTGQKLFSIKVFALIAILTSIATYLIIQKLSINAEENQNTTATNSQQTIMNYHWAFTNGIPKDLIVSAFSNTEKSKKEPSFIHPKYKSLYAINNNMLQIYIKKSIAQKTIQFDLTIVSQSHKTKEDKYSMAYRIKFLGNDGKPSHGKVIYYRQFSIIDNELFNKKIKRPFLIGLKTKAYFVNNYLFLLLENEIISISHFENIDITATPVLLLRNFGITKLSMKEIKTPPDKIAELLKNMPSGKHPKKLIVNYKKLVHFEKIYPQE